MYIYIYTITKEQHRLVGNPPFRSEARETVVTPVVRALLGK